MSDKIQEISDKLNMNFKKDELITLTVALLLEIHKDNHKKVLDYLDRCIEID